jgi:hypothetical protein
LDEFCFRLKRIEKRHFEYARNSYHNEFFNFPSRSLVLCLALLLVICLVSLMDLAITHIVLVHEKTALCLDALDTAHILIVVIVSRIGIVFLLGVLHSL